MADRTKTSSIPCVCLNAAVTFAGPQFLRRMWSVDEGFGEPFGIHIILLLQRRHLGLSLFTCAPQSESLRRTCAGDRSPLANTNVVSSRRLPSFNPRGKLHSAAHTGNTHCNRWERLTKPKRNAMKAEINQRIAALLENPEIEAVRVEVRTAFEVYAMRGRKT